MNRHKLTIALLALVMVSLLFSCSNKTPSQTITSLELEAPVGDVQLTDNGYALFGGKTYSATKDFEIRGYINNGQQYSYVNAKVFAKDALDEAAKTVQVGDNFRFDTGVIYDVWAEYSGLKSNVIQVCTYEANVIFKAKFDVDIFKTTYTYSDLIKLVKEAWYFTESGGLKTLSGTGGPGLNFVFVNSDPQVEDKILNNTKVTETIGSKNYDSLYIYSNDNYPFNIAMAEIKVYDPETDFDSIVLNSIHVDRTNKTLNGLVYAKKYLGTTVDKNISPFTTGTTTLKSGHKITISADGIETKTYDAEETVNFDFKKDIKYTVKLTLTVGEKELSASKKISF